MRPPSIVNFERLYVLSLALGIVSTVLNWDRAVVTAQLSGLAPGAVVATQVAGLVIGLALLYFIARRASVPAKWIFVALFVLGLIVFVFGLNAMVAMGEGIVIPIANMLLQAAAVWMLFRPDARAWFAARALPL